MKCYRCGREERYPLDLNPLSIKLGGAEVYGETVCEDCIVDIVTRIEINLKQLSPSILRLVKQRFRWSRRKRKIGPGWVKA